MKTEQRELARHLRRTEGASIKEIARRIGAAQSSVSRTRVVQSIFGAIQEYAGFQREAWLDAPG